MIDRLNRILSLSKKTGDTVIIHDPNEEHDLVVLPFGQYEELRSSDQVSRSDYDEYLLEEMSERELIDKINRDIAIWRSYQELNARDKQAALLEDQLADEPLPDPFEEDYAHHTDWHRVSDLITDRRGVRLDHSTSKDLEEEDPIHTYVPVQEQVPTPATEFTKPSFSSNFSSLSPEKMAPTPLLEDEPGLDNDDDDAVFFEEPAS
ncbi:MAG TPA: hypothetical protein PK295_02125 [Candidatus Magasanikbacteria bacterium]|nr:hypothetical protein [Candidatus Magasanikbacteria bacterium]